MIGRRSVVALVVLCALAISAFSVASASAETAYTCSKAASAKDKFGAHCLTPFGSQPKEFGHIEFSSATPISVTNEDTASETSASAVSVLAGSLSGVAAELQCTHLEGSGEMSNLDVLEVMFAHGTGTITYYGCTVNKPSGKGCVVSPGSKKRAEFETKELTTVSEGAGTLIVAPASGGAFATITIEKCTAAALNNTFPVTGFLEATVTGATATTTEAGVTGQGNLRFGGTLAGLGGALTIRNSSVNGNPLVLT